MDAPDSFKTINTIIQRGMFHSTHIRQVLYGSNDLIHWHVVWSSVDKICEASGGHHIKPTVLLLSAVLIKRKAYTDVPWRSSRVWQTKYDSFQVKQIVYKGERAVMRDAPRLLSIKTACISVLSCLSLIQAMSVSCFSVLWISPPNSLDYLDWWCSSNRQALCIQDIHVSDDLATARSSLKSQPANSVQYRMLQEQSVHYRNFLASRLFPFCIGKSISTHSAWARFSTLVTRSIFPFWPMSNTWCRACTSSVFMMSPSTNE